MNATPSSTPQTLPSMMDPAVFTERICEMREAGEYSRNKAAEHFRSGLLKLRVKTARAYYDARDEAFPDRPTLLAKADELLEEQGISLTRRSPSAWELILTRQHPGLSLIEMRTLFAGMMDDHYAAKTLGRGCTVVPPVNRSESTTRELTDELSLRAYAVSAAATAYANGKGSARAVKNAIARAHSILGAIENSNPDFHQ